MKDKKTLLWLYKGSKRQIPFVVLIAVLRTVMTVLSVVFALLSKGVIDAAITKNKEELLLRSALLVSIILAQIIIKFFGNLVEEKVHAKLEIGYKTKLYSSILRKDYEKITGYHSGDLLTRLSSDISIISSGIISFLPSIFAMLTGVVSAFFALVVLDRTFAILFLFGGVVLLIVISLFKKLLKNLHKKVQETDSEVRSFFQEAIMSILMIKVFAIEDEMDKKSEELQGMNFKAKMKRRNITVTAYTALSFVFSITSLFALVRCAFRLFTNTITFGTLTAVLQLVNQIQSPIAGLSTVLPQYFNILASAERVIEIEELPEEREEANKLSVSDYNALESIEFENIDFSYGRDIIFDDSLAMIKKGDFVVISGISGIGKSTLLKLLLGVIYPEAGGIYLKLNSGEKIPTGKHARSLFSYVPQGNLLLSGTIRESVAIVCPDATDERIMKAAKIACAAEFIEKLPEGLDTVIREKGAGLSEGQVQRLAVTRAILSDAPIILFDEATSALDEETEEKLLKNIRELKDKTCILISHKNAAYSICNKEIRLEDKKIIMNEK